MYKQINAGKCNDKCNQQRDQSQANIHMYHGNSAGKRSGCVTGWERGADRTFDEKRHIAVDIAGAVPAENRFEDVPADAWYGEAVTWAAAQGITLGTSDTTFSPDAPCVRAQIVTFLYRYGTGG